MKVINNFTEFLIKNNIIEEKRRKIYAYGLNQLIVYLYNFLTVIIVGWIFGMVWQSIAFTVFYMMIRPYAGGYHARTPKMCYVFSLIMIIAVLFLIKIIPLNGLLYLLIYAFSSIVIFKLSPVEDENKPLDDIERVVFRKRAIKSHIILSLCCLIFWFVGLKELSLCVVLALFTLSIMLILGEIKNRRLKREV